MTRKEFESLRREIEKKKLMIVREVNPIQFAMDRAAFKKEQLKTLICLGKKVANSKTVTAKVRRWERLIFRVTEKEVQLKRHIQL
jgi:hypothetical protein